MRRGRPTAGTAAGVGESDANCYRTERSATLYYSYFGLREAPFSIAVNPRYLYMSPSHRDALAHLLYGVGAGGGFIVLTGEVGTGKTTINRCLIEQLPDNADLAIVLNPALDARDLLATVCEELSIEVRDPGLKELTDALHRFLLDNHARGRKTVLMIDEAQHLSFDVLEQIRLLTNLETSEEKLLHIILLGQPELAARLALPELRQLSQRVTARYDLSPLSRGETAAYIRHRLQVAGLPAGRELFPPGVVRAIHRESGGVPRLINLLCDRMLLGAYGQGRDRADHGLLRTARREIHGAEPGLRGSQRWVFPAVAGLALLLVGAALVLFLTPSPPPESPAAAGAPLPADAEPVASDEERPAPVAIAPAPAAAGRREWFLAPASARELTAMLYDLPQAPAGPDPCLWERPVDLECAAGEEGSWSRLLADPRPALLALLDRHRFEGLALFLGFDALDTEQPRARLATEAGVRRVPLADVAELWTGASWQLWQRPAAIRRTLAPGDRGEDVRAAAALFAALDGQAEPLTDDRYSAALEQRVR
ncbi:MAG: AAA family ATPase, partial [Halieaceae bacterium]|nr:AAA family ATPase [Halieaceae bacterium]